MFAENMLHFPPGGPLGGPIPVLCDLPRGKAQQGLRIFPSTARYCCQVLPGYRQISVVAGGAQQGPRGIQVLRGEHAKGCRNWDNFGLSFFVY